VEQVVQPVVPTEPRDASQSVVTTPVGHTIDVLHEDPKLALIHDFITLEEGQHILQLAEKRFNRSSVLTDGNTRSIHDWRTSYTANLDTDDFTLRIQKRAAALALVPASHCEPLQVVRYEAGQFFKAHTDWFKDTEKSVPVSGNRLFTFLVYLNELPGEAGGATEFPVLGVKVQPKTNAAAFWRNLHFGSERGDDRTLHQGNAPAYGIKYAINIWIRSKPFQLAPTEPIPQAYGQPDTPAETPISVPVDAHAESQSSVGVSSSQEGM